MTISPQSIGVRLRQITIDYWIVATMVLAILANNLIPDLWPEAIDGVLLFLGINVIACRVAVTAHNRRMRKIDLRNSREKRLGCPNQL